MNKNFLVKEPINCLIIKQIIKLISCTYLSEFLPTFRYCQIKQNIVLLHIKIKADCFCTK